MRRPLRPMLALVAGPALLISGLPLPAAEPPWQAQWIGQAAPSLPNTWLVFRKQFALDHVPASAPARIACDSKYWLWINGRLVVFEGQLKRGPTPEDTYYDTVELAPYLREGANTVAVLVWYWGRDGYSHRSSQRAGLVFEADLGGRLLVSDASWKAHRHPAFGSTDPPHPGTALPEHNVRFDARADLPGWQQPGYDDASWPAAVELGAPPAPPWNRLLPRPIPLWRDSGLREYENAGELPAQGSGGDVVARLPYNAQVTPYLKVDAPAGLEIRIQTDNYTGGGHPNVRAVYVTRAGVQEYESLGWMSGHEVRYTVPAGVKILALRYRETGYDAEFAGRFESDDPSVNTLWQKARRTLYVTMRDSHMGDPDRERTQWWGDLVNELGQALYALDAERGPRLARKGFYELVRWRRADHTAVSPVPYGVGMDSPELPMQVLAALGWHGIWTYYWYTGDRQTIADVYPAARDYLRLWRLGSDGLVVHRTGDWDWPDWYDHADVAVLENAWYYLALRAAVEMARLLEQEQDLPDWVARMQSIESAFGRTFWQGEHYRSPGHRGEIDDRGNALAVVAGLARPEHYPALRRVLERQQHASPYMEKYVLEALYLMDSPDQAVRRMKRRWQKQIDSRLTTLWEVWDLDPSWNTYNHGWSGGALTVLSRYAVGVAPTAPTFASYRVLPQLGPLARVDAAVPTPHGAIVVRLRREPGRFRMELTSPPGTRAEVGIPRFGLEIQSVAVNGDVVWQDGRATVADSGVTPLGLDDRWLRLSVPPGAWVIEATGPQAALLLPDEAFNLSENPVRSDLLIVNLREPPRTAGVYTLDGARIVDLRARMMSPGRIEWDLTNERGTRVAAGTYLLVVDVAGEVVRQKLFIRPGLNVDSVR